MDEQRRYEVMIPVYWEQLDIIQWSIPYIKKYLKPLRIVLVGPEAMREQITLQKDVTYVDGNQLYDGMSKESVRHRIDSLVQENGIEKYGDRAGWYFQQFVKMVYSQYTSEKQYLVWDADVVPINAVSFWNERENKYIFITGGRHHHMVYYDTMGRLFNKEIVPVNEDTYVSHYMLIDSDIMREMIESIQNNVKLEGGTWWEKILSAIEIRELQEAGFSEFETYGEYVNEHYSDRYMMMDSVRKITNARAFLGNHPKTEQMQWAAHDYDVLGFEARVAEHPFLKRLCRNKNAQSKTSLYRIVWVQLLAEKLKPQVLLQKCKRKLGW